MEKPRKYTAEEMFEFAGFCKPRDGKPEDLLVRWIINQKYRCKECGEEFAFHQIFDERGLVSFGEVCFCPRCDFAEVEDNREEKIKSWKSTIQTRRDALDLARDSLESAIEAVQVLEKSLAEDGE